MKKDYVLAKHYEKLEGHKYAQASNFYDTMGGYGLKSYGTQVIHVDSDGWMICSGTYSTTTTKHIGWFLAECVPKYSYQFVKKLFLDGLAVNINTGGTRNMTVNEMKWARRQQKGVSGYYGW